MSVDGRPGAELLPVFIQGEEALRRKSLAPMNCGLAEILLPLPRRLFIPVTSRGVEPSL
ncbi:MAG: hypothetical protein QME42_09770 [bacterium]|nr:hypothetical protein [bacterium]